MTVRSDLRKINRTSESEEFPAVILIDNCNACNLRCSMCDHKNMKQYRKIQTMEMELYKRIIDEIAVENKNARVWEIFFGEPFLCVDIAERVRYAKLKGLQDVVLNSNGVLMTESRSKALIEAGLDAMYVGIDAALADTYNQIRVGGNLEKAVTNVLRYRDLLRQHGNGKQKLFVQFVVSDINESEVEAFKTFWSQRQVNVKIRPKVSWAGLVEATNIAENERVKRRPCYWLMRTINICADGRVALCSGDVHCRVPCGDAKRQSLKEIWQGVLRDYRRMHRQEKFEELPPMCSNCGDWQSAYADFVLSDGAIGKGGKGECVKDGGEDGDGGK